MGQRCEAVGPDDARRSAEQLRQLAQALGLPVEAFLGQARIPAAYAQRDELLRLWTALGREADRQRVLRLMRALAEAGAEPRGQDCPVTT